MTILNNDPDCFSHSKIFLYHFVSKSCLQHINVIEDDDNDDGIIIFIALVVRCLFFKIVNMTLDCNYN